jgi:hypothetical protein
MVKQKHVVPDAPSSTQDSDVLLPEVGARQASASPAHSQPPITSLTAVWKHAQDPFKLLHTLTAFRSRITRQQSELARGLLEKYGPYVPPSMARAERHFLHKCDHHVMFSLSRTRTSDLSEFGNGLMLYFWFLRCMAVIFTVLSLAFCLPLAIVYARDGTFFMSGVMRKLTFGNYGPIYEEGAQLAGGVVCCIPPHLVQHASDASHLNVEVKSCPWFALLV